MKRVFGNKLKYIVLAASAAAMAFGALQGQAQAVLHKAVMVCLECIGIG